MHYALTIDFGQSSAATASGKPDQGLPLVMSLQTAKKSLRLESVSIQ
jgi:hypothetical protein